MSTIKVSEPHDKGTEGARIAIAPFEREFLEKYGMHAVWNGHHAELKGKGASGTIDVSDSVVTVTVKLGILARAVGIDPAKLEKSIEKRLKAVLGGSPS